MPPGVLLDSLTELTISGMTDLEFAQWEHLKAVREIAFETRDFLHRIHSAETELEVLRDDHKLLLKLFSG